MLVSLYYIAVALLLFSKGIGLYDGTTAFKIFLIPALLCLAAKIFLTKYQKREIIAIGVLLGVGGIAYLISGEKGLLLYIMLAVGMKAVPVKRVFQVGLLVWGLAFFGVTISSLFHLYDTPFKVHDKLGLGHMFRWGLGYVHPNILHVSFLILVFFVVYLLRDKYNWKLCLLLLAANCYVFLYSVSYAGFGMVCIYLLLQLYWRYRRKIGLLEKVVAYVVFPLVACLSLTGPLVLEGRIYEIINRILNNRLILSESFLQIENVRPFGIRIENLVSVTQTMDNAYVFAFITYGFVIFTGIFIVYELLMHQMLRRNMGTELVLTITILGYGLVEPFLFNTSLKNLSVFFLGAALFGELELVPVGKWRIAQKMGTLWSKIKEVMTSHKKKIAIAGLLAGIVTSLLYGVLVKMPEAYMVQRVDCEVEGKDFKTFDEEYLKQHPEIRVVDYVDADTLMEVFSGNIVTIEWIRGCISIFLLGTVGAIVIVSGYYLVRNGRK